MKASPTVYTKAEARAQHVPSGRWHYVRAYGYTENEARLGLAEQAALKSWTLDGQSIRVSQSRKGER